MTLRDNSTGKFSSAMKIKKMGENGLECVTEALG